MTRNAAQREFKAAQWDMELLQREYAVAPEPVRFLLDDDFREVRQRMGDARARMKIPEKKVA
jgi:hypothetical protein